MKKTFSLRVLAEIAIFAALSFVLDILQGGIWRGVWASGGSVGIAMLPIIVISYRRGLLPGMLCGLVATLLNMATGVYAIAGTWYYVFLQILLDYIVAAPLVGVCGAFAKLYHKDDSFKNRAIWLTIGIIIGGLGKFLAHFIAGFVFWGSVTEWQGIQYGNAVIYSLVYNGTYMLPNIIICVGLSLLISWKVPKIFDATIGVQAEDTETPVVEVKEVVAEGVTTNEQ